jgi:hypothetical protein
MPRSNWPDRFATFYESKMTNILSDVALDDMVSYRVRNTNLGSKTLCMIIV